MLTEFIQYLFDQLGQPYLRGGQHTKLTPENYKTVIARRETSEQSKRDAEAYCEKLFSEGHKVLYAYDCSGLGCYWLYNLQHLYRGDVKANTMMNRCTLTTTLPKRGYWVFKRSGSKATHVGYMVTDTELIEAKGRKYGVCKTKFREKDWACWGIPKVFESVIFDPPVPTGKRVVVIGGSVNVRDKDSKAGKVLFVAHRGDEGEYIDTAPSGWYHVRFPKGEGYITNIEKYTRLEG